VREIGCAIIGQTDDIAPADRRFYAVRDVTATVESIDLITASILSKKIAAGLDALVMDVKFGSGAFMPTQAGAYRLAASIVAIAERAGMRCRALLTDMNEVLGSTAGNSLEVREAIDYLTGKVREPRLHAVTMALAAEMLIVGRLEKDLESAAARVERVLDSGEAALRFQRMVTTLGGPSDLIERPERHLAAAPYTNTIDAPREGYVQAVDVRQLGLAIVELGGGRRQVSDTIDPRVGLSEIVGVGEAVGPEQPLAICHAADAASSERCAALVMQCITIGDEPPKRLPPVAERVEP
jgi:thymidine phosphorylase